MWNRVFFQLFLGKDWLFHAFFLYLVYSLQWYIKNINLQDNISWDTFYKAHWSVNIIQRLRFLGFCHSSVPALWSSLRIICFTSGFDTNDVASTLCAWLHWRYLLKSMVCMHMQWMGVHCRDAKYSCHHQI